MAINIFNKRQHETIHSGAENFEQKTYLHRKLKQTGDNVWTLWCMPAVNLQSDLRHPEQEPSLALRQNK